MQDDVFLAPLACLSNIFFCLPALLMLVVGVFSLLVFALWLWMLIDVISREEKDFPSSGSDQKVLWILILVFGNWIGAFVYYLVVFKKSPKSK